jgi:hypothetical protein
LRAPAQLGFDAADTLGYLLPLRPRLQEVPMDDVAVWDLRAGDVDDR